MKELSGAEAALTGSLGRLFALAEAYPDLKANQTMTTLMEELTSTENKVSFARQAYNDSVMSYNTARESFPTNFVAGMFHFEPAVLSRSRSPKRRKPRRCLFLMWVERAKGPGGSFMHEMAESGSLSIKERAGVRGSVYPNARRVIFGVFRFNDSTVQRLNVFI